MELGSVLGAGASPGFGGVEGAGNSLGDGALLRFGSSLGLGASLGDGCGDTGAVPVAPPLSDPSPVVPDAWSVDVVDRSPSVLTRPVVDAPSVATAV